MTITLLDIVNNKIHKLKNVGDVKVRGTTFTIIFEDGSQNTFDFHEFDFFRKG